MPAIPIYDQQTQASGSIQANPTANDFGAQIAAAGENIGSAVERIGDYNARALRAQDERSARSWVGPAVVQSNLDWDSDLQNRFAQQLPGGPDLFPQVMQDFTAYRNKALANAPSETARDYYSQHLDAIGESIGKKTLAFDSANRVQGYFNSHQTASQNAAKLVQQNPDQYGNMLSVLQQTMPDVGPENRQKLAAADTQALTNAAASHWLDVDPYKVKEATS